MMIFVGIDWAEADHAIYVMDDEGHELARRKIPDTLNGVSQLQTLFAEHAADPAAVAIGIETDRGLLVRALRAAGYTLYAINPFAASRYRDRHQASGSKSDPGDAKMLANLVRTDRHNHRPVPSDSLQVDALQQLTRAHQRLIWDRQRHTNQLRNTLREFYPAALEAFPRLTEPEALLILEHAPTPERGRRLAHRQLVHLLRKAGRIRNVEESASAIQAALRSVQMEQPAVVTAAYGVSTASLCRVIAAVCTEITTLEQELATAYEAHPDAEVIRSLPGLGTILGARLLAEFGDVPTRYADSKGRKAAAGTAPITRTSGLSRLVRRRTSANRWLLTPCLQWAMASRRSSPGAQRYYQDLRNRGKTHNQALRALANRWVGILHGCLRFRASYDEDTAWPVLTAVPGKSRPATRLTSDGNTFLLTS